MCGALTLVRCQVNTEEAQWCWAVIAGRGIGLIYPGVRN